MKKALLSIAIALSSIAIIGITASSFIIGEIGSVVCLCGIMTGLSGLLVGGIVGAIEHFDTKNKNKAETKEDISYEPYIPEYANEKSSIETTNQSIQSKDNNKELSK